MRTIALVVAAVLALLLTNGALASVPGFVRHCWAPDAATLALCNENPIGRVWPVVPNVGAGQTFKTYADWTPNTLVHNPATDLVGLLDLTVYFTFDHRAVWPIAVERYQPAAVDDGSAVAHRFDFWPAPPEWCPSCTADLVIRWADLFPESESAPITNGPAPELVITWRIDESAQTNDTFPISANAYDQVDLNPGSVSLDIAWPDLVVRVPEPSGMAMMAAGLPTVAIMARRRERRRARR